MSDRKVAVPAGKTRCGRVWAGFKRFMNWVGWPGGLGAAAGGAAVGLAPLLVGAAAGAKFGAAVGTLFPVPVAGTAAGAVIGAALGLGSSGFVYLVKRVRQAWGHRKTARSMKAWAGTNPAVPPWLHEAIQNAGNKTLAGLHAHAYGRGDGRPTPIVITGTMNRGDLAEMERAEPLLGGTKTGADDPGWSRQFIFDKESSFCFEGQDGAQQVFGKGQTRTEGDIKKALTGVADSRDAAKTLSFFLNQTTTGVAYRTALKMFAPNKDLVDFVGAEDPNSIYTAKRDNDHVIVTIVTAKKMQSITSAARDEAANHYDIPEMLQTDPEHSKFTATIEFRIPITDLESGRVNVMRAIDAATPPTFRLAYVPAYDGRLGIPARGGK